MAKKVPITADNIDTIQKRYIIAAVRRVSRFWPCRNEALKRARVAPATYECAICKKHFRQEEIQIDHIIPVVKLTGFTTWDDYIKRMLPLPEGFQILCLADHKQKTAEENLLRGIIKKTKKTKSKKKEEV